MKKEYLLILVVGMLMLSTIAAVNAKQDKENCVNKPTSALGVATFTEGISFIMAGGMGPLIILAIAFVVGMLVGHLAFGGF